MDQSHYFRLFLITLVGCLTQFAADIYAPSLPEIATNFRTHVDVVQWSMAIYLFGVAGSQLVYGPLSDGLGRKSPLVLGLLIMLVGNWTCLSATKMHILIWGRLIQGCGAGACAVLWRSIFRDLFSAEDLAKYGSYLIIFIMFIIPAAPALGAYLQEIYSWRASFVFMIVYTAIVFILVLFFFKETSKHHHIERLKPKHIFKIYGSLVKSPVFIGMAVCTFLSYGAFFAWFVAGPVILISGVGMSPTFFGGITFFGGGSAYALAGWLNSRVVKRVGMANMMRFGWGVMAFSGILMLLGYVAVGVNSWVVVIPAILFYFGSTFIWPNAFGVAFTPFGHIAGYAAALYGFMQLGGGSALGGLMSYLPDKTQYPLALVMIGASIGAWIIYETVVEKKARQ